MKSYCQFDDLRKLADAIEAAVDEINDRLITPELATEVNRMIDAVTKREREI